jgi:hypothetical protein
LATKLIVVMANAMLNTTIRTTKILVSVLNVDLLAGTQNACRAAIRWVGTSLRRCAGTILWGARFSRPVCRTRIRQANASLDTGYRRMRFLLVGIL